MIQQGKMKRKYMASKQACHRNWQKKCTSHFSNCQSVQSKRKPLFSAKKEGTGKKKKVFETAHNQENPGIL